MSRLVIKLGTSTLTDGTSHLSLPRMVDLVRQLNELITQGHEIILVSSGAMAAGKEHLNFPQLPRSIPAKQMLSAVGQPQLMARWGEFFGIFDRLTAQVLLTRSDLRSRRRYLNARNALLALIQQGVVPIINENDTVATEEIRVGDNDNLSALVSNLIDADLLMLLTDQEGLFDADPRQNPDAQLVRHVQTPHIPDDLWAVAGGGGKLGTGGMHTKLQAADLARRSGAEVVIARGSAPDIILDIAAGKPCGTRFSPVSDAAESFKRYILSGGEAGQIVIDDGAARALRRGGSLLPAGVTSVTGDFIRGETVEVTNPNTGEIARGLVNYHATDCQALAGHHSDEIITILGYHYGEEIIHRNNLVLVSSG